jgi:transglutaminase-like putative cysteine protease
VSRRRSRDQLVLVDEIALAIVTFAAIVGMHRLFVDGSYRGPLIAQALIAHVVVTVLRRLGVKVLPAALITAGAAVLVLTWTRFPDTVHWGLPTGQTLRQAGDDLEAAWRLFGKVRAPAPVENGFLAASGAAIWVLVFVADWAAFRVSATFEALLPATTLFVFAAALGGSGSPFAGAAVFAGAALLFVLLHRTSNQERTSRWAGEHHSQGRWSLLGTGAALIAAAVVAGLIAGPKLPGAEAEPVVAWRDINRDKPTRVVTSPLVQLQTKILDQPDVELFSVESEQPSYWRLTSLDQFDGQIWRQSYSTSDADGKLPQAIDSAARTDTVEQTFQILRLASVWLPAAYEPVAVDTGADPADYDEQSSTLMVDRDVSDSDGYSYKVTSALPLWSAAELRAASTDVPKPIEDVYTDLPGDFPDRVTQLADDVTADAATPYDKAVALQDYLRGPDFTYNINVGPGHSEDALQHFLFESREGYCEQFAGSYAVMARAIGLPARVAVGFTWGVRDRFEPDLYRVRGNHAHAWPEVYIGEYGWVPMEPTPGRGLPGGEAWTGFPGVQDDTGGAAATLDRPETAANGPGGNAGSADSRAPGEGLGLDGIGGTASSSSSDDNNSGIGDALGRAVLPVAIALGAYLVLVPCLLAGQRALRRRRAATPSARVRLSWLTATDRAREAGVVLPASLTFTESAERMAAALPESAGGARQLALAMELITYAEVAATDDDVDSAAEASAAVTEVANRGEPWWRRVLVWFDARRLWRPRTTRLVTTGALR